MHDNGPEDLVMVFLCIQIAINKMHLCSLSVAYSCPYHKPTTTTGHSVHNVDIDKPFSHTTPYTTPVCGCEVGFGQILKNDGGGSVALCCVTKLHILEWPFIVSSRRCTCAVTMLLNQLLDMPHLSGGCIILAKEKYLLFSDTLFPFC